MQIFATRSTHSLDVDSLFTYLSMEKQRMLLLMKRKEEVQRKLLSELLLRATIVEQLQIKNQNIRFGFNEYGKPFLQNNTDFHFNISHSGEWVVCVIDNDYVGIDIEHIREIDLNIANRFFSQEEIDLLDRTPIQDRLHRFFDIWTLKESYLKAIGLGLSRMLYSFSILWTPSCNEFRVKDDICNSEYSFRQYELDPNYKTSICFKSDVPAEKIMVRDFKKIMQLIS